MPAQVEAVSHESQDKAHGKDLQLDREPQATNCEQQRQVTQLDGMIRQLFFLMILCEGYMTVESCSRWNSIFMNMTNPEML
jgi:hypothetical protein